MTADQAFLFALFGVVFVFLIWGRVRYDLVAFIALIVAVTAGYVPASDAFAGFGNAAVVIIALVLVVSRGLINSGAIELLAARIIDPARGLPAHIGIMAVTGAALSAVINNVAALALLMTIDMQTAEKAKRAVALSLMPLSFATILGGMITLIGTPPNIVIAQYRQTALGAPFSMFDFAPVGLTVAAVGILFVALLGWRLIPGHERPGVIHGEADAGLYVAEMRVPEKSKAIGQAVRDLYPLANEHDINMLGLIRRGQRLPGFARSEQIRKGDFLVVEGNPKSIEAFMGAAGMDFAGSEKHEVGLTSSSLSLVEAIVPDSARIAGRTALDLRLLYRHGVTLLGVSRGDQRFRDRVRKLEIEPGDVLLLLGTPDRLDEICGWLGVLPLAGGTTGLVQRDKALFAIAAFVVAIALSVAGLVYLPVALAACVAVYALTGIVGGTEIYESVEWKVIVLLACLIPLGAALEASGGTALIAAAIVDLTAGAPAWVVLAVLMAVTMTLSDFLNNVATALIAAPIGVDIARTLDVNPDAFLMGVAVAASCAFLTPIGHKNNTIIMGPGGYRFGDYWPMGLPLELLVLAVSVPAILVFWPL